ncbi:MAG: HD-GYP domain-containing protein [Armatimonadota bacterium]
MKYSLPYRGQCGNLYPGGDSDLETLMHVLQAKDNYTARHCHRVMALTVSLCDHLKLDQSVRKHSGLAALYHDVGKLGVTSAILNKRHRLKKSEWRAIHAHPTLGEEIFGSIVPCERVAAIISQHHEAWDGTGYPRGLQMTDISFEARLLHICDVYDALTSDRPYRPAYPPTQAISIIRKGIGQEFDPEIAAAFIQMKDQLRRVA